MSDAAASTSTQTTPLGPLPTATTIRALPAGTARALASSLALADPAAAVKELLDNALDAGATSVAVDLAANTLDHVAVRDNGRSVPPPDRALLGRRHATSKLAALAELRGVGARSLGFRGVALASLAGVVAGLWVTVRCEGEGVASVLRIGEGNGGAVVEKRVGAPMGTTVRAEGFFEKWPVRRQSALKDRERGARRVKRVLLAYALARPGVRLQLKVGKGKGGVDWVYAPKPGLKVDAGEEKVADAVWKVIGKDAAAQCAYVQREVRGYTIEAFLPKADAESRKIAGYGQFLSIDARPVSTTRGTMKQIAKVFRDKLKKVSPALEDVKEPFLRMDIRCPPGSYDPNVEPSKDDLLFDDAGTVLGAVEEFLGAFYSSVSLVGHTSKETTQVENREIEMRDGDAAANSDIFDQFVGMPDSNLTSTPQFDDHQDQESTPVPATVLSEHSSKSATLLTDQSQGKENEHKAQELQPEEGETPRPKRQRTWKYNMYDFDEDDLGIDGPGPDVTLDEDDMDEVIEQQSLNDVTVSNPWTMAKINARIRNTDITRCQERTLPPLAERTESQLNVLTITPLLPSNQLGGLHLPTPQPSSPARENQTINPNVLNVLNNPNSPKPSQSLAQAHDTLPPSPHASPQQPVSDGLFSKPPQQMQQVSCIPTLRKGQTGRGRGSRKKFPGRGGGLNKPFKSPINLERDSWFPNVPSQRPKRLSVFLRHREIPAATSEEAENTTSVGADRPLSDGRDHDIRHWMARRTLDPSVDLIVDTSAEPTRILSGRKHSVASKQPVRDFNMPEADLEESRVPEVNIQRNLTPQYHTSSPHQSQQSRESGRGGTIKNTPAKQSLRRSNRLMRRTGTAQVSLAGEDEETVVQQQVQEQSECRSGQYASKKSAPQRPGAGLVPLRSLSSLQQLRRSATSRLQLEHIPEGEEMHNTFIIFPAMGAASRSKDGEVSQTDLVAGIAAGFELLDPVFNGLSWRKQDDTMRTFGSEWGEVIAPSVVQKWADRLSQLLSHNKPVDLEEPEVRDDLSFIIKDAVERYMVKVVAGV